MSKQGLRDGFAVALAWPATYCKAPGSWYDPITAFLGINQNNYYRAGHAALVLIDRQENKCHYYDFGRYHAPYQHGRVRGALTDHDLIMQTKPVLSEDGTRINNLDEILTELQENAACHGDGPLHAAPTAIDFNAAQEKVLEMQGRGPIPYGPFVKGGSNCSRFVHTAVLAGRPELKYRLRLKFLMPFTPTPMSNLKALRHRRKIPVLRQDAPFVPLRPLSKEALVSTLEAPERHSSIPSEAQWLSGEGVGSWFNLEVEGGFLSVTRYAPDGSEECLGTYGESGRVNGHSHHLLSELEKGNYLISHPSNCKEVSINYKGEKFLFERIP